IETGRWVVQVARTGYSADVAREGEGHQPPSGREQAVIVREVPLRTGSTIYTALGDRPFIAAVAGFLALGLGARRRSTGSVRPRRRA
ncbi:MAG: apolipoprotein N-acyltransferase, partial [Ilumatobacteraceae bacterium]